MSIKQIDLDESMIRAIARQAEAERTRRANIIKAEGEQQAAQKLLEAARILSPVQPAMQLRYLATLFDIAGERSSTIVFPFPIDLMQAGRRALKPKRADLPSTYLAKLPSVAFVRTLPRDSLTGVEPRRCFFCQEAVRLQQQRTRRGDIFVETRSI